MFGNEKHYHKYPNLPDLIDKRSKNVNEIHDNLEQLDEHIYKYKKHLKNVSKQNISLPYKRNAVFDINENNERKLFFPTIKKQNVNKGINMISFKASDHTPFKDLTVLENNKIKKISFNNMSSTLLSTSTSPKEVVKKRNLNDFYILNNSIYDNNTLTDKYKQLSSINTKFSRSNRCYNYSEFNRLIDHSYINHIKNTKTIDNILEAKSPKSNQKNNLLITQLENYNPSLEKDTINSENSKINKKHKDNNSNAQYSQFTNFVEKINKSNYEAVAKDFEAKKNYYVKINNQSYLHNLNRSNNKSNQVITPTSNKSENTLLNQFSSIKQCSRYLNRSLDQMEIENNLIQNSINYDKEILNKFTRKKVASSDIAFHKYNEERDYLGYNKHKLSSQANVFKTLNPDTALRLINIITNKFQFSKKKNGIHNYHSKVLWEFDNQMKKYNTKINKANSDYIYDLSRKDLVSKSLNDCLNTKNHLISKIDNLTGLNKKLLKD